MAGDLRKPLSGFVLVARFRPAKTFDRSWNRHSIHEEEVAETFRNQLSGMLRNVDGSVNNDLLETEVTRFEAIPYGEQYGMTFTSVCANKETRGSLRLVMHTFRWEKVEGNKSSYCVRSLYEDYLPMEEDIGTAEDLTRDEVERIVMHQQSMTLKDVGPGYWVFKVCKHSDKQNTEETQLMSVLPVDRRKGFVAKDLALDAAENFFPWNKQNKDEVVDENFFMLQPALLGCVTGSFIIYPSLLTCVLFTIMHIWSITRSIGDLIRQSSIVPQDNELSGSQADAVVLCRPLDQLPQSRLTQANSNTSMEQVNAKMLKEFLRAAEELAPSAKYNPASTTSEFWYGKGRFMLEGDGFFDWTKVSTAYTQEMLVIFIKRYKSYIQENFAEDVAVADMHFDLVPPRGNELRMGNAFVCAEKLGCGTKFRVLVAFAKVVDNMHVVITMGYKFIVLKESSQEHQSDPISSARALLNRIYADALGRSRFAHWYLEPASFRPQPGSFVLRRMINFLCSTFCTVAVLGLAKHLL